MQVCRNCVRMFVADDGHHFADVMARVDCRVCSVGWLCAFNRFEFLGAELMSYLLAKLGRKVRRSVEKEHGVHSFLQAGRQLDGPLDQLTKPLSHTGCRSPGKYAANRWRPGGSGREVKGWPTNPRLT